MKSAIAPSLADKSSTAIAGIFQAPFQVQPSGSQRTAHAPLAIALGMNARPSEIFPPYAAKASPLRTRRLSATIPRGRDGSLANNEAASNGDAVKVAAVMFPRARSDCRRAE